ncbi:MAG: four helix bundle protein [Chloroflexaceae bacterium]|jgi:four helix bundle protein|nr:four helix bundle protein [Chloroflexaceae bacterium]
MTEQQLKDRTKQFALRVIRLVEALPNTKTAQVIGNQILRSGTSVGANYRAACRSRSNAAMIARLDIVLEEADETLFWLELLCESNTVPEHRLMDLMEETDQLIAITVASLNTLRRKSPTDLRKHSIR